MFAGRLRSRDGSVRPNVKIWWVRFPILERIWSPVRGLGDRASVLRIIGLFLADFRCSSRIVYYINNPI